MRDVGAPTSLTELGYGEDDLEAIVAGALEQRRLLVGAARSGHQARDRPPRLALAAPGRSSVSRRVAARVAAAAGGAGRRHP